MKTSIKTSMFMLVLGILCSCSKDDAEDLIRDPKASIVSIIPSNGPKETLVTISGKNFGSDINKIKVFFNDKEAIVKSIKDSEIVTEVPIMGKAGQVHVQAANGIVTFGPDFEYEYTATVSTYVGSEAYMNIPTGIAMDANGILYVADTDNHRILVKRLQNDIEVLAGSTEGHAEGTSEEAKFRRPKGVTVDDNGNIYVADTGNHRIRKITPDGMVTTLAGARAGDADGTGLFAQFKFPTRIIQDSTGKMYVSDAGNNRIRVVTPEGEVTTLAGSVSGTADGIGSAAQLYNPVGMTLDDQGTIYVADNENQRIRKVTAEGMVSTYTGSSEGFENGPLENALFDYPSDIVFDNLGNLIVADNGNCKIRWISPEGKVKTLAGSIKGEEDGIGEEAKFINPNGICKGPDGNLYVTDTGSNTIRKITLE